MTAPHLDNIPLPIAVDKTSSTDDERITNVVPLPPPEHLIRFFPVQDTPAEGLINRTRHAVQDILGNAHFDAGTNALQEQRATRAEHMVHANGNGHANGQGSKG